MKAYVTKSGRAIGHGRVTRRQHLVRTSHRGQSKPLPIHIQCHPMAQSPTPVHPNCHKSAHWGGHFINITRTYKAESFMSGRGLQKKAGRFALYIQGKPRGYTDDAQYGLGWQRAANKFGHDCELVEA